MNTINKSQAGIPFHCLKSEAQNKAKILCESVCQRDATAAMRQPNTHIDNDKCIHKYILI